MIPGALTEKDLEGLPALGVLAAWRVRVGSRLLEKELRNPSDVERLTDAKERAWQKTAHEVGDRATGEVPR